MSNTVAFHAEDVKEYLDECIRYWRRQRLQAQDEVGVEMHEELFMHLDPIDRLREAIYYLDAFQSVRVSLFGELLP